MATFQEANQLKSSLKMRFVNYAWFKSVAVVTSDGGYDVIIYSSKVDNSVRKLVPQVINGVGVKLELE